VRQSGEDKSKRRWAHHLPAHGLSRASGSCAATWRARRPDSSHGRKMKSGHPAKGRVDPVLPRVVRDPCRRARNVVIATPKDGSAHLQRRRQSLTGARQHGYHGPRQAHRGGSHNFLLAGASMEQLAAGAGMLRSTNSLAWTALAASSARI
jgi:hypothetical protein